MVIYREKLMRILPAKGGIIITAKQPAAAKPRKRGKFPLNFPRIGNQVDPQDLCFQWTPPKTRKRDIFYRLMVY
jgi:hypothetical protein